MRKTLTDISKRFNAPTPKKAKRVRFISLLSSFLSTIGLIGSNISDLGILSSKTGNWIMLVTAVSGALGGFISQLQTEN